MSSVGGSSRGGRSQQQRGYARSNGGSGSGYAQSRAGSNQTRQSQVSRSVAVSSPKAGSDAGSSASKRDNTKRKPKKTTGPVGRMGGLGPDINNPDRIRKMELRKERVAYGNAVSDAHRLGLPLPEFKRTTAPPEQTETLAAMSVPVGAPPTKPIRLGGLGFDKKNPDYLEKLEMYKRKQEYGQSVSEENRKKAPMRVGFSADSDYALAGTNGHVTTRMYSKSTRNLQKLRQKQYRKSGKGGGSVASTLGGSGGGGGDGDDDDTVRYVCALYACQADEEDELDFQAGEIIAVLDESDPNWWVGVIDGVQGVFPSSYVQDITPAQAAVLDSMEINVALPETFQEACEFGRELYSRGEFGMAIRAYNHALSLGAPNADVLSNAHHALGSVYLYGFADLPNAERHLKENLALRMRANSAPDRLGDAYGALGATALMSGDTQTALRFHTAHYELAVAGGDALGEGRACCGIANSFAEMGDYVSALSYHQRDLMLARTSGNKEAEARASGNVGNCYYNMEDFGNALAYHNAALGLAMEVGDKAAIGKACSSLGITCRRMGDYAGALVHHARDLEIAIETGDRVAEGLAHSNMGLAHARLSQFDDAIREYAAHLRIAKELGDNDAQARAYGNMGRAYQSKGDNKKAGIYFKRYLSLAAAEGRRLGDANFDVGMSYESAGDYTRAATAYRAALGCYDGMRNTLSPAEWEEEFGFSHARVLVSLITVLVESGNTDEALLVRDAAVRMRLNRTSMPFRGSVADLTDVNGLDAVAAAAAAGETTARANGGVVHSLSATNLSGLSGVSGESVHTNAPSLTPATSVDQFRSMVAAAHTTAVVYATGRGATELFVWVVRASRVDFVRVPLADPSLNTAPDEPAQLARLLVNCSATGLGLDGLRSVAWACATGFSSRAAGGGRSAVPHILTTLHAAAGPPQEVNMPEALTELYDMLIAPIETLLPQPSNDGSSVGLVTFVADTPLAGVPYAALLNRVTSARLIENVAIAYAPSLVSLSAIVARRADDVTAAAALPPAPTPTPPAVTPVQGGRAARGRGSPRGRARSLKSDNNTSPKLGGRGRKGGEEGAESPPQHSSPAKPFRRSAVVVIGVSDQESRDGGLPANEAVAVGGVLAVAPQHVCGGADFVESFESVGLSVIHVSARMYEPVDGGSGGSTTLDGGGLGAHTDLPGLVLSDRVVSTTELAGSDLHGQLAVVAANRMETDTVTKGGAMSLAHSLLSGGAACVGVNMCPVEGEPGCDFLINFYSRLAGMGIGRGEPRPAYAFRLVALDALSSAVSDESANLWLPPWAAFAVWGCGGAPVDFGRPQRPGARGSPGTRGRGRGTRGGRGASTGVRGPFAIVGGGSGGSGSRAYGRGRGGGGEPLPGIHSPERSGNTYANMKGMGESPPALPAIGANESVGLKPLGGLGADLESEEYRTKMELYRRKQEYARAVAEAHRKGEVEVAPAYRPPRISRGPPRYVKPKSPVGVVHPEPFYTVGGGAPEPDDDF